MATKKRLSPEKLSTPERNDFFYGKLMDVDQFRKDQDYFNYKRWLINRLVLGSGVVSGLNVVPDNDEKKIRIEPGVAIDGWGREIIVPDAVTVDPYKLTDEQGKPTKSIEFNGDTGNKEVFIYLAYKEKKADPVPVLVPTCDAPGDCAPSTICEEFRVLVQEATPQTSALELGTVSEMFVEIVRKAPKENLGNVLDLLHKELCDRVSRPPPKSDPNPGVLLAKVGLKKNKIQREDISVYVRHLVCENTLTSALILSLLKKS